MKKAFIAVFFGIVIVIAGCGTDSGSETDVNLEEEAGETADSAAADEIYQTNCANCHGGDLSGGAIGPDLTQVGAEYSAEEIADIIKNGKGSMPAFPNISGEKMKNLSNWLAEKQ